jgi:hypothetical protein
MSALLIEPMDNSAPWTALEADGITPSTELSIADDNLNFGRGADGVSQRITATGSALGHLLRRPVGPLDISGFSELRLSIRSRRQASTADTPLFLELRLGSAALPIGNPANTWHRLLPVITQDRWETVKLSLDDLPAAVAGALTAIELACASADPPFTANVDDVTAVQPEMILDTNRALERRLTGIVVDGQVVPAAVRSAGEAVPGAPALDVVNTDVQSAPARARDAETVRDYTNGGGVTLVPIGDPYDLYNSITPLSTASDQNAAMIEAVLQRLAPFDELDVDGDVHPVEALWIPRIDRPAGGDESPVLFYKVGARQASAVRRPVRRVDELRLATDQR